ncbi:hypothetical protein D3C72_1187710 [compost metagenome]
MPGLIGGHGRITVIGQRQAHTAVGQVVDLPTVGHIADRRLQLLEQRLGCGQIVLVTAVRIFAQVVQGHTDHLLRRVGHGYSAVLELAGVFGFEQQVKAVQRRIAHTLAHRFKVHPQSQRAPGVRHRVLVAGVHFGQLGQQVLVQIAVAGHLLGLQRLQGAGRQSTGQQAGGRHNHVITTATGEQLGFQYLCGVERVVPHLVAAFLFKALQNLWRHVIGPAVEVEDFFFGLKRQGQHHREQPQVSTHVGHLYSVDAASMHAGLHC